MRFPQPVGVLVVVLVALGVLAQAIPLYTDWLWFQEVGYTRVFTTILSVRGALFTAVALSVLVFLYANLTFAVRTAAPDVLWELEDQLGLPGRVVIEPIIRRFLPVVVTLISLGSGLRASAHWETMLAYLNAEPFGAGGSAVRARPRASSCSPCRSGACCTAGAWPWWARRCSSPSCSTCCSGVSSSPPAGRAWPPERAPTFSSWPPRSWSSGPWGSGSIASSWSTRRGGSSSGRRTRTPTPRCPPSGVLAVLAALCAATCVLQIGRARMRPVVASLVVLAVVWVGGLGIYPALLQRFRVTPNELEAERPFIAHNIRMTRQAYGLDRIVEQEFPARDTLDARAIDRNEATIKNIRLWDYRPLLRTYGQLQEIRTYYKFVDVDNDRYTIGREYRQLMLSPRELSYAHLQPRIWINEHLNFTHGYGVVVGPVNRVTPEGLPEFFVKDIPPVSTGGFPAITRPQIYYGEIGNEYVLVRTRSKELDYSTRGTRTSTPPMKGEGASPSAPGWPSSPSPRASARSRFSSPTT